MAEPSGEIPKPITCALPNLTCAPCVKPLPKICICVPPAEVPRFGLTALTARPGGGGLAEYVNCTVLLDPPPSVVVTTTGTMPAACAGVTAWITFEPCAK